MVVLGEPAAGRARSASPRASEQLCVFELIYFARPDSYMLGRNLYEVRRRMGEVLAREAPAEADLVMPVPDTGAPPRPAMPRRAASRTARAWSATDTPAGRSSSRSNGMRQRGVTVKLSALREQVRGRRLIVVDDSIVRGTTTRQIVGLLRKAGAKRGPRPNQRAADLPPVLLRHRHADRDRADRRDQQSIDGDPRVHRRRFAVVPVDRRRARRDRPAARPLLLRLLRRQLPGARPVRRRATTSSCSSASQLAVVG